MDGSNDNHGPVAGRAALGLSKLSLFLPVAVIAAGYGAVWLWLEVSGQGGTALARLCLAVLLVGVPLLAVHAALRLATFSMKVMVHAVHLQPGFPSAGTAEIPWSAIRHLEVRCGPGGWLTGAGTLVFHLTTGGRIAARGLAQAHAARALIEKAARARAHPIGMDGLQMQPKAEMRRQA
ncbi:MAG: hypothetical protein KDJ73_04030 [Notoacmeibacter sp.]|nr:hypothetical protein [Notoacmeibacter sp.]